MNKRALAKAFRNQWLAAFLAFVVGFGACTAVPGGDGAAPDATPSMTSTPAPRVDGDLDWGEVDDGEDDDDREGRRGNNVVRVTNDDDSRFIFRSNVDLKRTRSRTVTPVNRAEAMASCTDCQTIAVAIQVVLYQQGATNVSPQNYAAAINQECSRCFTVARAIQFVIPVEDPRDVPRDVDQMVKELNRELRYFEQIRSLDKFDVDEAMANLDSVLRRYDRLRAYLFDLMDKKETDGSATPTTSATAAPASSSTPSPSSTPSGAS